MRRSAFAALLLVVALSAAARASAASAPRDTVDRATTLVRWAEDLLARPGEEDHQRAVRMLEEALRLRPEYAEGWLARGRANELGGFDREARACYARAAALTPDDPDPWMRLGMEWRHEWLRWLAPADLDSAIANLGRVLKVRPYAFEARLRLVPLLYERGSADAAMAVAEAAARARPLRGEPAMAIATLAYRRGEIARADSLFRWGYDRVAPDLRRRLDDLSPVLGDDAARVEAAAATDPAARWRVWDRFDPDPTTPQNELLLEFWSRVVHAWLLYDDPLRPGLDARAEAYVRYGPPQASAVNPQGVPLFIRYKNPASATAGMEYPINAALLAYPELGMRIVLQDRSLTGRFDWPLLRGDDTGPAPDPKVLAKRRDLLAFGNGLSVFPTLPPPDQRLAVHGTLARFEGEKGPRLFVQVTAPAAPGDTLTAVWVVRDSSGRARIGQTQTLVTSVCDPAARKIAQLSASLPAGAFDVAVSVRDTHRRRGLFRAPATMAPAGDSLALSDVVLTCGDPTLLVQGRSIRLESNTSGRVPRGAPLVAYFEIYRLAAAADGQARFEYTYTVRRLFTLSDGRMKEEKDPSLASTSASREETQAGTMRRQFVTVPAQSLTPGLYRLEIRVRDLTSGALARGALEFTKE